MASDRKAPFRVVLTPHRSLSRQGFLAVDGVDRRRSILSAGTLFFLLGAWPVVGFMGLDVALIWWAFRANFAVRPQGRTDRGDRP